MLILIGFSSLRLYHLLCSLFPRTDKCISSLFPFFCLICGFKTWSWKSSIPLFAVHLEGRLCWLVPLSSDIVEAAHGKHPRKKKDILLRLAGSWILNGIVKIKQSERGVPACVLERSVVDTFDTCDCVIITMRWWSGQMFIETKICLELFTVVRCFVIVVFAFTFWCERELLYLICHQC